MALAIWLLAAGAAAAVDETLTHTGPGSFTANAWTECTLGGSCLNDGSNTTDGTSDYNTSTSGAVGSGAVTTFSLPGGNGILRVRVYVSACTEGNEQLDIGLGNGAGGTSFVGSGASVSTGPFSVSGCPTFTEYWEEWTSPPGGSWNIDDLEILFQHVKVGGTSVVRVGEARIVVTHKPKAVYNSKTGLLYMTIQEAVDALGGSIASAEYIEIRDSDTYAESVSISGITGTSSTNTLTIKAQSGKNPVVDVRGKTRAFLVSSTPYVIFEGIHVKGDASTKSGFRFVSSSNGEVRRCIVEGLANNDGNWIEGAVAFDASSTGTVESSTLYNNYVGIELNNASNNVTLKNNIIVVCASGCGTSFRSYGISLDSGSISTSNYNLFHRLADDTNTMTGYDGANRRYLSDWQSGTGQDGNSLQADPKFVDAANGNFHLKSTGGHWTSGTSCGAATFSADAEDSPALDAGDPTATYSGECSFNGNRINLGAFGNTVQASKTKPPTATLKASADVTPATIYVGQSNVEFLRVTVDTQESPTLNQVKVDVKGNASLTDSDVAAVKVYISDDTVLDLASDTLFGSDTTSDIVTNGAVVNGSYTYPKASTTSYIFILVDIASSAAGDETIWLEQRYDDLNAVDYYSFDAFSVTNTASPVYFQTDGGTGQAIVSGISLSLKSRVDNIAGKSIGPGQTDVHMMSVRVEATGNPSLTGVTFDVGGTVTCSGTGDVTNVKVYISADANFDGSDTLFGSTVPSSCAGISVTNAGLALGGTQYVLFLLDIGSAAAGKTVSVSQAAPAENLYTIASGTKDAINDPYTSSTVTISSFLTVCASGCDHTTIQAAVNAISGPVSNAWTIEVRDSRTYAEMVTVSGKSTNATNTLTIRAQKGQTPVVDPPNAGGADKDGFSINDAYVTIEGFRITGPELKGIRVQSGGDNCTIRNNVIDNIPQYSNTPSDAAIYLDGASGCQIISNTIYYNYTDGDSYIENSGVYFRNSSSGATVRNNIFVKMESVFWFSDTASQTGFSSDYNLFFDLPVVFGRWNASQVSSFSAWKDASGQDGNSLNSDPLFVSAGTGNFHLQSTAGHWTGGGCSAPTFSDDASDSPAIDKGRASDSYSNETNYNGDRLNMGAYGNTCFASRTPKQFNLQSRVDNAGGINIYAGDTNKHFMSVKVNTKGDPELTRVDLTIGGTVVEGTCSNDDIAQVKVYISSDSTFDGSDTFFGSYDNGGSGIDCVTSSVTGSYKGAINASYYILILLDIKAGATVGETVKVVQAAPAENMYTVSASYTTSKSAINDPYESSLKTIGNPTAGPKLLSAVAEDTSGLGDGINNGDTVKLTFDKATNAYAVNSSNINTVLSVSGKTWGGVSSASWSTTKYTNDTLTITLDGTGSPAVAVGDSISIGANTIEDGSGNDATGSPPTLTGSWAMKPDWTGSGGLAFEGSPVIRSSASENTVFVGNNDGKLYAFKLVPASPPSAETKWTYNVGAEISSLPYVLSSTVYFGATDGKVYAVRDDGTSASKKSWSPKVISTSPVKSSVIPWQTGQGEWRLYVGGDDNKLHAFRDSDGSDVWSTQDLGGVVTATASISGDGYVYIGSEGGGVYKVDINDGSVTNQLTGLTKVTGSPFIRYGKMYFGAWNKTLYEIDTSTWTTVTTFCAAGCELNDATLAEFKGTPWVTSTKVYAGNSNGKLYCLQRTDPFTYCSSWSSVTLGGELVTLPIPYQGRIYVTSTDGKIYVVDESTGSLVKTYDTGDAIVSSPAFYSGKMAVSSKSGKVYVFTVP